MKSFRDVVVDDAFVPLVGVPGAKPGAFAALLALDGVCIGKLTGSVGADGVTVDRFAGPAHLDIDADGRVYCCYGFDQRLLPCGPDTPKTLPLGIQDREDTDAAAFGWGDQPGSDDWMASAGKSAIGFDALLALVFPFLEALRAAHPEKPIEYCLWGWGPDRATGSHALTHDKHRGRLMAVADVKSEAFRDAVRPLDNGFHLVQTTRFARVGRRAVDLLTARMSWKFV